MKIRTTLVPAVLVALVCAGTAFAQDPPSRVARLNWLSGNVSFQPDGIDTWTAASLNYPLTTGDHIYTDSGSRAELHVGPNAFRLNGQSNFGFLNLDDRTVQVRFTEGALEVRLRRLEDDDIYEVDTPQGAVSLLRTGDYRFDADPSRNATMITVWSGEADVAANGRSVIVHAGQTAYLPDGFDADIRAANPPDDFDAFTQNRNLGEDRVPPPVHVSESMAGYEDLDRYGTWNNTPDYGWAWAPRVVAGWAPYQEGQWAWVEPWGWTWVDQAPWGFAPFHYGRWAYARNRWLWVPGAVIARPVYAPALVAFVGGPNFNLSLRVGGGGGGVGGGVVAWFPLGPREPFYPAHRVSNTYIRQVNITHVTNINVTNVNVTDVRYVNRQVPGAVVAMPRQGFVSARPVREFGQRVPAQQLTQAQVVGTAPQIAPTRESIVGVQSNRRIAAPSQAEMSRPVVARSTPPPPAVSFQARQQMIERNQGRPLAPQEVMQLRRQPGAVVNRPQVRPVPQTAPRAMPQAAPAGGQPAQAPRQFGRPPDQNSAPQPERQPDRPRDRLDTRPPNARPVAPVPASPNVTPPPARQEIPQMTRPRPEERPAPAVVPRVVPRPPEQNSAPQPERQPDRPRDRLDTRPPNARPVAPVPGSPNVTPPPARQEIPQMTRPRPEERPAPAVVPRPAPEAPRQPSPAVRPAPEARPQPQIQRQNAPPVRDARPEAAPRRDVRPAPAKEQRRDERKEEKKAP
jgi:hypothetical protein